jgi:hypothetical protein
MTETLQRLKDSDWEVLLRRIKEEKCTPFLGTGIHSETTTLRAKIAEEWAREYEYPLQDVLNLARVARFISIKFDADFTKGKLVDRLNTMAAPNFDDADNPYSILAALPLPVYITTNYDDYMVRALTKAKRDVQREMCRWNAVVNTAPSIFETGFKPTVANPLVFHFHGWTDELESLVLTEDDYFEFLINVSRDRSMIPTRIEKAMTGTSLLLLGYRLDDWDFRVMFHLMASYLERSTSRTHVAVQIAPVKDETPEEEKQKAQDYLNLYFEKYKKLDIRIYWGSCSEFISELKTRWDKSNAK